MAPKSVTAIIMVKTAQHIVPPRIIVKEIIIVTRQVELKNVSIIGMVLIVLVSKLIILSAIPLLARELAGKTSTVKTVRYFAELNMTIAQTLHATLLLGLKFVPIVGMVQNAIVMNIETFFATRPQVLENARKTILALTVRDSVNPPKMITLFVTKMGQLSAIPTTLVLIVVVTRLAM